MSDAKKFYRKVGRETINVRDTPDIEEVEKFWRNIWNSDKEYNIDAKWIKNSEVKNVNVPE